MSLPARIALSTLSRPTERHRYGPHRSQVADLHLPSGDGPHPLAVVIHGGYWQASFGKLITRPLSVDLARRGYAAWNLEYRRLGRGDGGGWPATFEDIGAGIDHVAGLEDPRLDTADVTIIGHSAGGHLALWAGARPDLPPQAPGSDPVLAADRIVALAAVSDLRRGGNAVLDLLGGTQAEVPDRWRWANPIEQVPLGVPVLLGHPAEDRTVSVSGSRRYAARAAEAGADVTLIEPPATSHSEITNPANPGWHEVAAWIDERVGLARRATPR